MLSSASADSAAFPWSETRRDRNWGRRRTHARQFDPENLADRSRDNPLSPVGGSLQSMFPGSRCLVELSLC